jgi:hypothetical protein
LSFNLLALSVCRIYEFGLKKIHVPFKWVSLRILKVEGLFALSAQHIIHFRTSEYVAQLVYMLWGILEAQRCQF